MHKDQCSRAVVQPAGVCRGHRAVFLECGAQPGKAFHGHSVTNIFVGIDDNVTLATLHRYWCNLILESSRGPRGGRKVLRPRCKSVLHFARNLMLFGKVFRSDTHVIAVEYVCEPIFQHRVDQFDRAHLRARAQCLCMRGHRHVFLSSCDDDGRVACDDRLSAHGHGAQSRAANLVDAHGGHFFGNACCHCCLPRRVLALCRSQNLPKDDIGHFVG